MTGQGGNRRGLALASVAIGLALALLLLEGLCRLLPVNQTMLSMPVDEANPVLRFAPDRTTTWSRGPRFCLVNRVHANNYGFINDQDYHPAATTPLLAVIGDSYIEALMLPWRQTGQGLLAESLKGRARVYSFARSGAPLSQYLAYAEWAKTVFRPNKLVLLVIGNDYDESLLAYKSDAGFHYYSDTPEGLALSRQDYRPGWGARLVSSSRLLLYLLNNMQAHRLPQLIKDRYFTRQGQYVAQVQAEADPARLSASRRAVDQVLAEFPERSGLAPENICFVVNGLIPDLYTGQGRRSASDSYAARMNAYFMDRARTLGFRVIDMQPLLAADFDRNRESFDFSDCDGHWNARAHALFAKAVLDSGFLDGLEPAP